MKDEFNELFKKWFQRINGPMALITQSKLAYIQGSKDATKRLSSKIADCLTYEEVMDLIRKENDSVEQIKE